MRPPKDPAAELHRAAPGADRLDQPRHVAVVGGGIAGLAAAAVLAERGTQVTLFESCRQLGGRVRSWPLDDGPTTSDRTMSRGFHAFFRQYYTLRSLLRRADPDLDRLTPVTDYPLMRSDGLTDSFATLPKSPPASLAAFVVRSPTFPLTALPSVHLPSALELIDVSYPASHERYDGESAAAFLDRLRFPEGARHLALEVFARSFFAHPEDFSAGELVGMFHAYFTGSAEGLLFDVPDDDYDTALWAPLGRHLGQLGVQIRTGTPVQGISPAEGDSSDLSGWQAEADDDVLSVDAVVLATDPRTTRTLLARLPEAGADADAGLDDATPWHRRVAAGRNAPPFAVLRLWFDGLVDPAREAFLGTSDFDLLDNVTVLERFEQGAAEWSRTHGGSVVELHGYAVDPETDPSLAGEGRCGLDEPRLLQRLMDSLHEVYPETAPLTAIHQELLIEADCPLVDTSPWRDRLAVETPHPGLVLAGDGLRVDWPVALMERAAVTGVLAANSLLGGWGVRGEDVWTVPLKGLLRRRRAALGRGVRAVRARMPSRGRR